MKAIAAVMLFGFCVVGAFYADAHEIGNAANLLGIAAFLTLFLVWEAISDD